MLDMAKKNGKVLPIARMEPSEKNDLIINTINKYSDFLGWTANKCLLTKPNAKECSMKKQSLAQTESKGALDQKAIDEAQKWKKKYSSADQIPDSELPLNFDLRNISGSDFTGSIRKQGNCGSCYTQAFVQAI